MDFDIFFFNDTATTEIYTLSLHDALPIYLVALLQRRDECTVAASSVLMPDAGASTEDRKSTRLNSSHPSISYAVFCLKKKKKKCIEKSNSQKNAFLSHCNQMAYSQ